MKAVTWWAPKRVSVEEVADPVLQEPTDAIIRVTSTGVCGSDLHMYSLDTRVAPGDILGHETMGIVEQTGSAVTSIEPGDRVVVPFNVACGKCWMCVRGLTSQCETTRRHATGMDGQDFGFTALHGAIPGGQAELQRVPQAQFGPVKVPDGEPDHRYLLLSDALPTAWQGASYAEVGPGDYVVVIGLGLIGQLAARVSLRFGADTVIGVDRIAERLHMAARFGIHTVDPSRHDPAELVRELTRGRGADAVIEAVGMEGHGTSPPFDVDHTAALRLALDLVRRGGAVSILGTDRDRIDSASLADLFEKQVTLRMGQTNVRHWMKEILPELARPDDPLGVDDLTTREFPLTEAPTAYDWFAHRRNGCLKVVLRP